MSCQVCPRSDRTQPCRSNSCDYNIATYCHSEPWSCIDAPQQWCSPPINSQPQPVDESYQPLPLSFQPSTSEFDSDSLDAFVEPFDDSLVGEHSAPAHPRPEEAMPDFVSLAQPARTVTRQFCRADTCFPRSPLPHNPPPAASVSQRGRLIKKLTSYCQIILQDLNQHGFCVIDDFVQNGEQILSEVLALYQNGLFRDGQLVSESVPGSARQIRSDQIIWVEGTEQPCSAVGYLVRILDTLVAGCNASKLGQFHALHIRRRTKAMLACYPGKHSKYVRHVDNPNRDGRCITSIYYLNKDYDRMVSPKRLSSHALLTTSGLLPQKDGGVLRLFPQMDENIVADIEPKFNRVIFFWSDRRNPHEVMPSSRMRFAITVWYFDENERAMAQQKYEQNNRRFPNHKAVIPF